MTEDPRDARIRELEAQIEVLHNSRSFRYTAPLRHAGRFLRREPIPPLAGGSPVQCEIHVPISPTPAFFNKVHFLAASVRAFGGPIAGARIVVTVGDGDADDLPTRLPWSREYGIEWRWVDRERFARHGMYATALERFGYDFEEPHVLFLDADTLVVNPVDPAELRTEGFAGLTALVSFAEDGRRSVDEWRRLFGAAGLGEPPLVCRHSGWGVIDWDLERRYCPPYFNLGVLFASRDAARAVGRQIYSELDNVNRTLETFFRCQIALTLAIVRLGIPWRELPLQLNFPNDVRFWRAYPGEARDARIVHYWSEDELDRTADFETLDAVDGFLKRPVGVANQLLHDRLRALYPRVASESVGQ